jgi:hypothetical protein
MGQNLNVWAVFAAIGAVLLSTFPSLLEQSAEAATDPTEISALHARTALSSFGITTSANAPRARTIATQQVQRLAAADYLKLIPTLNAPPREATRAQTDLSTVQAGPATLALSRFFPSRGEAEAQVWIEATLADIPNLSLLPTSFARIEIERVQRADGVNIYASQSRFETDRFETLTLEQRGPSTHQSGVRTVRISSTAKRDDVAYVTGNLTLTLPIEAKALTLDTRHFKAPQLLASGASVELVALNGSEVAFLTTGRPEAYVTVYGYDSAGNQLAAAGESVSATAAFADRKALFHGKLHHVRVVFAAGYLTKKFPFVLKGPGARRRQSIGPQPQGPTGPLIVEQRSPRATSAA